MAEYIERDALLSEIQTMRNQHLLSKCDGAKVERMARQLPAADVEPVVHGRWIDKGSLSCRCSNCGCKSPKEYDFCPHCGAKLDLEKEMEEK